MASEVTRVENSDAAFERDEKALAVRYEKVVQRFYRAPPLQGNAWPILVHDAACVLERRAQQLSGRLYVSFDTALYFRAERSTFGKPLALVLEYDRLVALRIVGERASDMRTLEFELLAKESAHHRALRESASASATETDDESEKNDSRNDSFERHCFTFSSVDERRAFWDVFHK